MKQQQQQQKRKTNNPPNEQIQISFSNLKKKKAAIYWGHGPLTESLWSLRDEAQKMDKK